MHKFAQNGPNRSTFLVLFAEEFTGLKKVLHRQCWQCWLIWAMQISPTYLSRKTVHICAHQNFIFVFCPARFNVYYLVSMFICIYISFVFVFYSSSFHLFTREGSACLAFCQFGGQLQGPILQIHVSFTIQCKCRVLRIKGSGYGVP